METLEPQIFSHWLDHTVQLAQRICVVVMAAFISIRVPALRRALRGAGAAFGNGWWRLPSSLCWR